MTVFARICFEVNCCNCIIIFALALNLVKHCSACGNTFTSAFAEIIYDGVYTSGRYDGCVNDHRIERFILHTPTKQILKGTFLNLHKLFEIGFNDCGVSVIEPGFAENLTTIRIFKAERDYLQVIEHNVFNTLPLELIDVSANRISYIEDYAFEGMDLKYLCLSGNKLSSINSTWFRNTKILALAITHNEIRSLDDDTFSGLIELVTLKLNFNKIISISPNAFLNIKCCLTKVYLPGNSIVYLDFKTPNELVEMDVGFNQISSIPLEDTTTLRKISIHPNPWSCGCLTQFKKECEKKNIEIKDTYALKEPTTGVNPICVALNITCTNIRVDAQKLRDIYFSLIDYNAFGNYPPSNLKCAPHQCIQQIATLVQYGIAKTHWRRQPILLITSVVKYNVNYLGSAEDSQRV
ncbi:hypothetical protein Trydic_g20732 [Trypoxylus dichotomus]